MLRSKRDPYDDLTLMPFGKYEGIRLMDVPAKYLFWLLDNQCSDSRLIDYIQRNKVALKKEDKDRV